MAKEIDDLRVGFLSGDGRWASDIDTARKSGGLNIGVIAISHLGFGDEAAGRFVRHGAEALGRAFAPASVDRGIRGSFAVPPLGGCTVTPGSSAVGLFEVPVDRTPAQSRDELEWPVLHWWQRLRPNGGLPECQHLWCSLHHQFRQSHSRAGSRTRNLERVPPAPGLHFTGHDWIRERQYHWRRLRS